MLKNSWCLGVLSVIWSSWLRRDRFLVQLHYIAVSWGINSRVTEALFSSPFAKDSE